MEAITLIQAKEYLKIDLDYTLEDDLLNSLIKSAREYCERYTGLSFIPKQLRMYSTDPTIRLLYGPVNSITHVKNDAGELVTYRKEGLQFPRICVDACRGFTVTYETGYLNLPENLKTAVKMLVATLYDNRENNVITQSGGSLVEMPFGVTNLLRPYSRSGGLFL